jgi:hypothetical protein
MLIKDTLFPLWARKKPTGKNHSGQRKWQKWRQLAAEGEKAGANGNSSNNRELPEAPHAVAIQYEMAADDCKVFRLGLRDQHAVERVFVGTG